MQDFAPKLRSFHLLLYNTFFSRALYFRANSPDSRLWHSPYSILLQNHSQYMYLSNMDILAQFCPPPQPGAWLKCTLIYSHLAEIMLQCTAVWNCRGFLITFYTSAAGNEVNIIRTLITLTCLIKCMCTALNLSTDGGVLSQAERTKWSPRRDLLLLI